MASTAEVLQVVRDIGVFISKVCWDLLLLFCPQEEVLPSGVLLGASSGVLSRRTAAHLGSWVRSMKTTAVPGSWDTGAPAAAVALVSKVQECAALS